MGNSQNVGAENTLSCCHVFYILNCLQQNDLVCVSRFCDLCSRMDKGFPTLDQNAETPEGVKDKKLNIFFPKSSYIMFNIKDKLFICCSTIHIP